MSTYLSRGAERPTCMRTPTLSESEKDDIASMVLLAVYTVRYGPVGFAPPLTSENVKKVAP